MNSIPKAMDLQEVDAWLLNKKEPRQSIQMRGTLNGQLGFHLLHDAAKSGFIVHSQISEHLAINLDH